MTQPTVGRVVWFWPSHEEQMALPPAGQPLAAHVAAVSEDGSTVNLQVIDANGHPHARQDVLFFDQGPIPEVSSACWMPYQRAQHAKQETGDANRATSVAPWNATDQATGVGGVIDSAKAADTDGAESPEGQYPPRFATTQATADTNYETVATPAKPSAGGSSRFSSAS